MQQYDNTGASQLVIATVWEKGGELFRLVDQTEAADLSTTESIFKLTCIAEGLNNAIDHARKAGEKAFIVDAHGKMPAWSHSLETALAYAGELAMDFSATLTEIKDGIDLRLIKASLIELALDMIGIDHAEQVAKHKAEPSAVREDKSPSSTEEPADVAVVSTFRQVSFDRGATWMDVPDSFVPPKGIWLRRTRTMNEVGTFSPWSIERWLVPGPSPAFGDWAFGDWTLA